MILELKLRPLANFDKGGAFKLHDTTELKLRPLANFDKGGIFKLHDTTELKLEEIYLIFFYEESMPVSSRWQCINILASVTTREQVPLIGKLFLFFFFSPLLGNGPIKSVLPKDVCFSL